MRHARRARFFLGALIFALVAASIAYLVDSPGLKRPSPRAKEAKLDQAEVVIDGFHFTRSDSDRLCWVLDARRAETRKGADKADLHDLHAVFNCTDGNTVTLKADRGVFDNCTKAVQLTGRDKDVTITSSKGYNMRTRDLNWNDRKKELTTDDPVVVKGDRIKIQGKGLVLKSDLQEVRITNGVRTEFYQGR